MLIRDDAVSQISPTRALRYQRESDRDPYAYTAIFALLNQ